MNRSEERENLRFTSFGTGINVAIVGATGGVGKALVDTLEACPDVAAVARLSRSGPANCGAAKPSESALSYLLDLADEASISAAAAALKQALDELHLVIVATGILHDDELQPEKSWNDLKAYSIECSFRVNATGPALVAKHFLPLLAPGRKSVFAAISARVGSIEDNRLAGWYAYRASKAALNMIVRSLAIELARKKPSSLCVALHPGTVNTNLSKPFRRGVPEDQLFAPLKSARYLLGVLDGLSTTDSGKFFAWDGAQIPF